MKWNTRSSSQFIQQNKPKNKFKINLGLDRLLFLKLYFTQLIKIERGDAARLVNLTSEQNS